MLFLQDMKGGTTARDFEVTKDESSIIIGVGVKELMVTDNIYTPSRNIIKPTTEMGKI